MVDLNLAFANDSMSANAALGMTPAAAAQQTYSPSFTSFSEILASAQNSFLQSQDETSSSATLVQQFQSQQSGQNAISDNHSGDGGGSSVSTPDSQPPVKPSSSKSTTDSTKEKEDTYVAHGSKDRIQGETDRQSMKGRVDRSADQAAGSKPAEKAKHSRTTSQTSGQPDPTETTEPEVNPVSGSYLLGQAVPASAGDNAELAASQNGDAAGGATRGVRKPKGGDSNIELAFAVKVQGDSVQPNDRILSIAPGGSSQDPGNSSPSSPFSAELGAVLAAGQTATSSSDRTLTGLSTLGGSTPQPAGPIAGDSPVENASQDAPKVSEVPEAPTLLTQPVKTVDVQITGSDNQRVDLRLMEKSGTLTMSVRSADGNLTKALQQNLPELATRLNDQEIRAEWWKPASQSSEPAQKLAASSNTNSNNNQDQGGQNKGSSGQPGGRGARQTDWLDELSELRKSTKNGTQLSWHL